MNKRLFLYFNYVFFVFSLVFFLAPSIKAQQPIVTNQQLNQRLMEFQTNFELNPPAVFGATPPLEISGSSGKISFVFKQTGRYDFSYGSIQFLPTTPISATRFITVLTISQLELSGDAVISITKGKNSFTPLNCSDSKLSIVDVQFTSQVEFDSQAQLILDGLKADFDPSKILVKVPCLEPSAIAQISNTELKRVLEEELRIKINDDSEKKRGGKPGKGTIQITSMALQDSVRKPDSIITRTGDDVAKTNCTMVTASAASACGLSSINDIKAIFADLSRIPNQNNLNSFKDALQLFNNDLQTLSQTLSPFGQKTAQKFIEDLTLIVSDGQINTLEQENLTASFYNLVLTAGISSNQLGTIENSLLMRLSAISGVSTKQLQTSFDRLFSDVQPCLRP
ncbi:MAG: hypothetical protein HY819_21315 [Acidobacteria bacterium]|nr:hypothetical protein [Acidobacteriota bacterium]